MELEGEDQTPYTNEEKFAALMAAMQLQMQHVGKAAAHHAIGDSQLADIFRQTLLNASTTDDILPDTQHREEMEAFLRRIEETVADIRQRNMRDIKETARGLRTSDLLRGNDPREGPVCTIDTVSGEPLVHVRCTPAASSSSSSKPSRTWDEKLQAIATAANLLRDMYMRLQQSRNRTVSVRREMWAAARAGQLPRHVVSQIQQSYELARRSSEAAKQEDARHVQATMAMLIHAFPEIEELLAREPSRK